MKTYMISYDLIGPHRDYDPLIKKIKSHSTWAKPLSSVWLVKSNSSAGDILSDLRTVIDSNDELIVLELGANWSTWNISKEVTDWMYINL